MNRTWEKVLAWIANVILIFATGALSLVAFRSSTKEFLVRMGVKEELELIMKENPKLVESAAITDSDVFFDLVVGGIRVYSTIAILVLVLAIIASFLMKRRILSGILFLLVALLVTLGSFTILYYVGFIYLVVAIMLLVRKEPKNQDPFDPNNPENKLDGIKYV
ncbi:MULTISPECIES: DUF4064 domain-containing protein [unclassified Gemella]|uniref:DUF4064 domain-containing protein n=1 Tax=unclassified Gemella TaxID=2624949 RepID=UPI001073BDA6|nr:MULTISPECIES: DUF4064 domain-containing protein [unclassified Gemella]MBF0710327.1 DUF4064 domain-containing protein [Gemella sp. GL1.1]MBF0747003.1 DUF4064 domain-containing protein [Gemella sp. 19428wG2_WT2a]NYS27671.1 DUF4064 domain-containing protein [Gemella sp. GL1]TFU58821.1 DUF4064 domain-containing protein [Gemella sp. WT2a]